MNNLDKKQKKLRSLLKIEKSSVLTLAKGTDKERTEWQLPDGSLHREFGPAVEYKNGRLRSWWINGKRHREDGPALECFNNQEKQENKYYIDGNLVSKFVFTHFSLSAVREIIKVKNRLYQFKIWIKYSTACLLMNIEDWIFPLMIVLTIFGACLNLFLAASYSGWLN